MLPSSGGSNRRTTPLGVHSHQLGIGCGVTLALSCALAA